MEIFQIAGIGLVATILAVILRQHKEEFAIQVSLVTGLVIFVFVIAKMEYVVKVLSDLADKVDLDFIYFSTILKVIGIAYITEFAAQVSRDADEGAIASKIELGGKILIMVISMPILIGLLDLILKIMP